MGRIRRWKSTLGSSEEVPNSGDQNKAGTRNQLTTVSTDSPGNAERTQTLAEQFLMRILPVF